MRCYLDFNTNMRPGGDLLAIFGQVSGLISASESESQPVTVESAGAGAPIGTSAPLETPPRKMKPNQSSIVFSDEIPEPTRSAVKVHTSPGGVSSISFGGGSSTKPGTREPNPGSVKVIHPAGGQSSLSFGSGASAPGSSTPAAASKAMDAKKCAKLSDAIYKQGSVKSTFTKFCGDPGLKRITKAAFLSTANKIAPKSGITGADVAAIFTQFAKKDVMGYSEFVKLVRGLGSS